jgi:uncharacterized protein affecting Mg2+/Co2+ transport
MIVPILLNGKMITLTHGFQNKTLMTLIASNNIGKEEQLNMAVKISIREWQITKSDSRVNPLTDEVIGSSDLLNKKGENCNKPIYIVQQHTQGSIG